MFVCGPIMRENKKSRHIPSRHPIYTSTIWFSHSTLLATNYLKIDHTNKNSTMNLLYIKRINDNDNNGRTNDLEQIFSRRIPAHSNCLPSFPMTSLRKVLTHSTHPVVVSARVCGLCSQALSPNLHRNT